MTSVLVDAKKKIVISDSRCTNTITRFGKVIKSWYTEDSEKTYYHKTGKLLAASFGNTNAIIHKIEQLGFIINDKESLELAAVKNNKDIGSVFIIGADSNKVVLIRSTDAKHFTTDYLSEYSRCWAGSGMDVMHKIFKDYNLDIPYEKVIRYCAMRDKYTNDIVQIKTL